MSIQFFVSDTFSQHYLPFMLYRNILKNVCDNHITKNISEIYDLSGVNNVESNILILNLYTLTNEDTTNDSSNHIFTFLQNLKAKVVLINTEFYTAFNINNIMEKINQSKLNWYILEYNNLNYNYFKTTYPNVSLYFLPLIYNEYLETYYKSKIINNTPWNEKTDILFFGSVNERRLEVLKKISTKYKVGVVQGLTGEKENISLCNHIQRAKIVINIAVNEKNIVFDYYRNSFLLANKVLLISERPNCLDTTMQKSLIDIENNFILADYDKFYEVVDNYLSNYNQQQIEDVINKQYNYFKSFNMKDNIIDFFNNKLNFYKQFSLFKVFMSNDVLEPLNKVIMSGFITQGPQVDKFEEKLCEYFNNKYVLTLNSATSGLTLALRLLINEDKEENWPGFNVEEDYVLSPALTCFATNASILANNCKIKWIDVDKNTANVSLEDIKNKLNKNTKIVYVVHWGGYPVELDELKVLQEEHLQKYGYKFRIIEDCAHAFGATYNNKMLGSHGNICVFSLQAIKHLTTGDGGLIILPDEKIYERAKLLRWFGIDRNKRNYNRKDFRLENDIEEWGYKFHMNDINATIGLYNLPYLTDLLQRNRSNYMYLYNNLKNINGLRLFELKENRETSAWLFTMAVERKSEFVDKMKEYGIATSQVHNRNDLNTCVSEFKCELPNINELEKEMICIPVGWWLETIDLDFMIEKIKTFYL
jgi:dTDP-4-amino-4,6-dideoxygalactose transaminase